MANGKFPVSLPNELKERLEKMSKETGMTQSNLIRMATHSLIVNYETKGGIIFADLLNPEHKTK
ncbi:ribbon-helix-helix domain-containing protein [Ornithinibacillus contaminans]|uniref:ribbon-helix-helix domain-containing protein n=1 Tax=Ornithinibacillus contaminans TaxID=694055 RepID=UPI00064D832A|nr:CopG family transcriptional regulator [Ornithinibacillus contaminans]